MMQSLDNGFLLLLLFFKFQNITTQKEADFFWLIVQILSKNTQLPYTKT